MLGATYLDEWLGTHFLRPLARNKRPRPSYAAADAATLLYMQQPTVRAFAPGAGPTPE